jgi:hypothetical protein
MGVKLAEIYSQAMKDFGMPGRMKLAMLTKVPSEKAKTDPDTPEMVELFNKAMKVIREKGVA